MVQDLFFAATICIMIYVLIQDIRYLMRVNRNRAPRIPNAKNSVVEEYWGNHS